jgi:citrate lyase subunit beta/citryl-CoA lyase
MARTPRSWLFVPGDSEKKLGKAGTTGADAIIVDLEDSVTPQNRPTARALTGEWLRSAHRSAQQLWVRINPLDGPDWRDDVVAVLGSAPHGLIVPKAEGPAQLQQFAVELAALESRCGLPAGVTKILPLVSETAASAITVPSYFGAPLPRLAGMMWGAEDLSAAIGAARKYGDDGHWTDTFRMVRATVLLTAHACGIPAIDTLHADFRDEAGLERFARAARADGFAGMLAIHPGQVAVINAAFTPTEAELAGARAIIAAFAAQPDAGTLSLDGKMLDKPHLELARRLLGKG